MRASLGPQQTADVLSGLLLPDSVLSSPWFQVLAAIVAFNTIVYVGLTVSKLIPLPRPLHPSKVRSTLGRLGIQMGTEPPSITHPAKIRYSNDVYQDMRLRVIKRDVPRALALIGSLDMLLALVSIVLFDGFAAADAIPQLAVGALCLLLAQIFATTGTNPRVIAKWWAVVATVIVLAQLLNAFDEQAPAALGFALVFTTAAPPITLAWRPAIISGGLVMATAIGIGLSVSMRDGLLAAVLAGAALLVGGVLLSIRISSLRMLAAERERSEALASTDDTTGVLTRNGLESLLPTYGAIAERLESHVCVMVVGVDNLAETNEVYGVAYGDKVLTTVAECVGRVVRTGDLVARWSPARFVVVGIGKRPEATALGLRVQHAVTVAGTALGKDSIDLRVGTSAGDPREVTYLQLLDLAIAHSDQNEELSAPARPTDHSVHPNPLSP